MVDEFSLLSGRQRDPSSELVRPIAGVSPLSIDKGVAEALTARVFLHDGVVLLGASRWILTEHGLHVPIVRLAVSRHFGAGLVQYAVLKASSFFVHLFLLGLVEVCVCRTGFSTLHQR